MIAGLRGLLIAFASRQAAVIFATAATAPPKVTRVQLKNNHN
jgi:hypothetical protein